VPNIYGRGHVVQKLLTGHTDGHVHWNDHSTLTTKMVAKNSDITGQTCVRCRRSEASSISEKL